MHLSGRDVDCRVLLSHSGHLRPETLGLASLNPRPNANVTTISESATAFFVGGGNFFGGGGKATERTYIQRGQPIPVYKYRSSPQMQALSKKHIFKLAIRA